MNIRPEVIVWSIVDARLVAALLASAAPGLAAQEIRGAIAVETRAFPNAPAHAGQDHNTASVEFAPELFAAWDRGRQGIRFEPFLRIDVADGSRTHFDIREASWFRAWETWELRVGVSRVFWGVTESVHLVDIVNQTDLVENLDGEDKLGQPMVNATFLTPWGDVSVFVMPYFRERTYPGRSGRLRAPIPVNHDVAEYESGAGRWHPDLAVRWSNYFGNWDIGVSQFVGTGRDPRFVPSLNSAGDPVLAPRYDLINQTGLDVQYTAGGWLWKFEGITRGGQGDRYAAVAGGFEYTVVGVLGSAADVGILAEYLADTRGRDATTPFDDDVFLGTRLAFNDVQSTSVLAGVIVDRTRGSTLLNVEAERRLGEDWTVDLELRAFFGVPNADPLHPVQQDDHLQVRLARHF